MFTNDYVNKPLTMAYPIKSMVEYGKTIIGITIIIFGKTYCIQPIMHFLN